MNEGKAMKLRGMIAGLGVLVLAGCGGETGGTPMTPSSTAPESFTFRGMLTLYTDGYLASGGCSGRGGYSDIRAGAGVTVYDNAGAIVGIGSLGPGLVSGKSCQFAFAVDEIPTGKGFYSYEISHRGKLTLTEDEAVDGFAQATLNDN